MAKTKEIKMCQSCMMPLKDDEREGKTGLDPRYCSLCFHDGDFAAKDVSAIEFRDAIYQILIDKGWSKPKAWIGTRYIPKLPRWQQDNPDQI